LFLDFRPLAVVQQPLFIHNLLAYHIQSDFSSSDELSALANLFFLRYTFFIVKNDRFFIYREQRNKL